MGYWVTPIHSVNRIFRAKYTLLFQINLLYWISCVTLYQSISSCTTLIVFKTFTTDFKKGITNTMEIKGKLRRAHCLTRAAQAGCQTNLTAFVILSNQRHQRIKSLGFLFFFFYWQFYGKESKTNNTLMWLQTQLNIIMKLLQNFWKPYS